jgi:peroxiredoxin
MKKLSYIVTIALFLAACSSEPHYVVKGNIEGSDSITFFLQKRESGKTITIDSAVSKKGHFTMKGGKVDYPQMVQLVAGNTRKRTSFYLENSDITIEGSIDSLYKATVTGSKTEDQYMAFVDANRPLTQEYSKIYVEYQTAHNNGDAARVEKLEKEADSIQTEMTNLQKNFVKNNPSSYVTPSMIVSLSYEMEAPELDSMITSLDTTLAKLPMILELKKRVELMKSVAVGQKAPDFTMNDVNDNPVSLYSKVGSKLLLVDFWAAWCNPCRQENPNVVKVYGQFHKKGFDVFGVSLDRNKEDWMNAINNDKLTWTQVSDLQFWDNAAAKLYAVSAIPANFLLNEEGIIIGKNLRGEDLYNKVNEILGEKK